MTRRRRHITKPVFSRLAIDSDEEIEAELRSDLVDRTYQFYVAEHAGRVIGTSIACSLEKSSGSIGLSRPDNARMYQQFDIVDGVGRTARTVAARRRRSGSCRRRG